MAARFKNKKYYRKLSKKERRQFRLNCEAYYEGCFKKMLNSKSVSNLENFLSYSFHWDSTKQGHSYWFEIVRKKQFGYY